VILDAVSEAQETLEDGKLGPLADALRSPALVQAMFDCGYLPASNSPGVIFTASDASPSQALAVALESMEQTDRLARLAKEKRLDTLWFLLETARDEAAKVLKQYRSGQMAPHSRLTGR
jgi:hypothetical protein